ncbi:MAG: GGDEF domain-containing protein [Atopobiaceae bacterium]|nr:GGDEF domain-containing protein [Atopobiaceae bacterium]
MRRYRIGLLVGNKSIEYIHTIRMGVQNTLEEAGHVLVAISDLIPFHSRENAISYFRVAFEVAARLDLDAIIVPAGIIASYLTDDHVSLGDFLGILDRNKTLVIEREIPGYRCVAKDNAAGMHECMRHLIETQGFRRIAFIGGPESSTGARQREEIFFEEMAAHGLPTPPSMIEHGEFSGECGDSIDRLIDNNRELEAIVCCCDLIAHSVYRVMGRRKLAVGQDIAVTGFDDNEISTHLNPPLSTVHITGYDLGCMAAREAIRICEGKPQEEPVLASSFIARSSCGEDARDMVDQFRALLEQDPTPIDQIADLVVDSTLSMATQVIVEDFSSVMREFVLKVQAAYQQHVAKGSTDDQLFSSQDLNLMLNQPYRDRISLDGFQSAAIALLKALVEESHKETAGWVIEQISNLHLGIARMLNADVQETKLSMRQREWTAFHIADDAMRESNDPRAAYQLILKDLQDLGIRQADLYLLPEPVSFIGVRSFALSDTLLPKGHLSKGRIRIAEEEAPIPLQELLDVVIPPLGGPTVYTVGGIMAGDELMGVVAIDAGTLDNDGQLIAFLNLGIALKHMQMIASERESNEMLSRSNLLLERQSHYDEMTGVLNRRGFMSKLSRIMNLHQGHTGALFYFDLDGLKTINDTFGHKYGDEAIRQTTRVLSACLPPDAILGRIGGDEFIAFAPLEDEQAVRLLGHSVDAGMATFNATHSYPFDLSASYGSVFLTIGPDSFADINKTMVEADERLYEMKKTHGSRRAR